MKGKQTRKKGLLTLRVCEFRYFFFRPFVTVTHPSSSSVCCAFLLDEEEEEEEEEGGGVVDGFELMEEESISIFSSFCVSFGLELSL